MGNLAVRLDALVSERGERHPQAPLGVRMLRLAGMNAVYAERVGANPPARSTIEVGALPSGALVEIEAIALA